MNEEWYIDGYNLIHGLAGPQPQKRTPSSRKVVLSDLLSKIAGFASARRKVLVVLDGVGDNNEFRAFRTESLDIVYSGSVSADACIERSLYTARGRAHLSVVTNDRAIAQIALGVGARVHSPEDFMNAIKEDMKAKEDILFKHRVKSHGFNRPLDDKLKKFE